MMGEEDLSAMRRLLNAVAEAWRVLDMDPPSVSYAKLLLVWADRCADRFRPEDQGAGRPEGFVEAIRRDEGEDQALFDLMLSESNNRRPISNHACPVCTRQ